MQREDKLTDELQIAQRAVTLNAKNFHALHTLLALLLHTDHKTEFDTHLRRYLEEGSDDFHQSFWTNTLNLLKQALHKDKEWKQILLTLFDSGQAGQRWRPLREALMAICGDNPFYLNGIAPETREPASNILCALKSADLTQRATQ